MHTFELQQAFQCCCQTRDTSTILPPPLPDTQVPFFERSAPIEGLQLPDPDPESFNAPCPPRWQLAAHGTTPALGCLLHAPNGCVGEWAPHAQVCARA